MCSIALACLVTGILAAVNTAKGAALPDTTWTTGAVSPYTLPAANAYVCVTMFLLALACGILYPIFGQEPQSPRCLRSSRAWFIQSSVLLAIVSSACFTAWILQLSWECADQFDGDLLSACHLALVEYALTWLTWLLVFANFIAAWRFYRRRNGVPVVKPQQRRRRRRRNSVASELSSTLDTDTASFYSSHSHVESLRVSLPLALARSDDGDGGHRRHDTDGRSGSGSRYAHTPSNWAQHDDVLVARAPPAYQAHAHAPAQRAAPAQSHGLGPAKPSSP